MRISKASLNIEDPALLARILLLGTAFVVTYYCFSLKTPPHCWERVNHLSVFGFLPESVLGSAALFSIARVLCIASLGLWLLHRFIPWSPIVATLSFTALVAQHVEMSFYTSHTFHFATNVLIVLCAWYCFDRSRMSAIRPGPGYFKGTAPRWVFITILSYIAISYTHSGLTKLLTSGGVWIDGSVLQLWIMTYGTSEHFLAKVLLENRSLATLAQGVTLLAEATILLALVYPRLLPLYGVLLCGFHISVELIFHLDFYGNILIDFIILLAYPIYLRIIQNRGQEHV